MLRFTVLLSSLAALGACGDNHDNSAPDAGADSAGSDAYTPTPTGIAVAGDFNMTGVLSKVDITTLAVTPNVGGTGSVAGDPVVRQIGAKLYVVNRFGANSITVFDAKTLAFVDQYGTGTNTNPQDVAQVGNNLYVPALGSTGMIKIALADGAASTIDLGTAVGDTDGNPDCVSAIAVGSKVYVACGLLDENYSPRGAGKVAVYDTGTNAVTNVITLPAPNPQNFFVQSPTSSVFGGDLLIPLIPSFTDYSMGCVARVSTGASPTATCAQGLSNQDIAGMATHLDVAKDSSILWLAVGTLDSSFANPTGSLKGFDLETGSLWTAALSPSSQLITDVAACPDGSVIVSDTKQGAAGVRVYKDAMERTTAPLAIGLPPGFGNNLVCYDLGAP